MHVCPKLCAGCAANMSHNSSTTAISFFLQPVLRVYHSSTMLSSKVSLLSCQNPFCLNFNKKPFATQAAYTQHIDRNIGCYNFIVRKSHVTAPALHKLIYSLLFPACHWLILLLLPFLRHIILNSSTSLSDTKVLYLDFATRPL